MLVLLALLGSRGEPTAGAPAAAPIAIPDDVLDQSPAKAIIIDVLANDIDTDNDLDPTTVRILNPANLSQQLTQLVVDGEGVWTVNAATGTITFQPCVQAGNPIASCTDLFLEYVKLGLDAPELDQRFQSR